MTEKMKAGAKMREGAGNFEVIELDRPCLRDENDVLFRVTSVGMCGTDVSIYKWTDTVAKEYHPRFPLVIGHEMSGIVEQVGRNVTRIRVGDHVAVNEHIFCGVCEMCREGRTCICEDRVILGCHVDGAMTEQMVVRELNCFKLPESIPLYAGSIAEPLSVAVHAIDRVPAGAGDVAVVFGVGTIGLGVSLVLVQAGVTVLAVGIGGDETRLALAKELGAIPLQLGKQDLQEELRKLGKKWADVAYECSGAAKALNDAIDVIKPAGTVCEVGIPGKDIPVDIGGKIVFREKSIVGSRAFYHKTWGKTMALLESCGGKAEKLITHKLPLEEFEKGIDLITSGACVKVVVTPSD